MLHSFIIIILLKLSDSVTVTHIIFIFTTTKFPKSICRNQSLSCFLIIQAGSFVKRLLRHVAIEKIMFL
jgi:hypothetical protein